MYHHLPGLAWVALCLVPALGLAGCRGEGQPSSGGGGGASGGTATQKFDGQYPIQVVVTVGMVADLVRGIGGEHVEVTQLMGSGTDPHLYKATRDDSVAILKADIVFYNGLLLEGKMSEMLDRSSRTRRALAVAETLPRGVLNVDTDQQGHPDPHVWMDVARWRKVAQAVAAELSSFDPAHAEDYRLAAGTLDERLAQLHAYGLEVIACIPREQRVLVTSHDAFRYFGEAYGVEVQAVQGISTESEAGLRRINELVDLLVERKIKSVFVESSVPKESIESLLAGADRRGHTVVIGGSLYSDAMGEPGTYEGTYVGMMDHNFTTIAAALGCPEATEGGFAAVGSGGRQLEEAMREEP